MGLDRVFAAFGREQRDGSDVFCTKQGGTMGAATLVPRNPENALCYT